MHVLECMAVLVQQQVSVLLPYHIVKKSSLSAILNEETMDPEVMHGAELLFVYLFWSYLLQFTKYKEIAFNQLKVKLTNKTYKQ